MPTTSTRRAQDEGVELLPPLPAFTKLEANDEFGSIGDPVFREMCSSGDMTSLCWYRKIKGVEGGHRVKAEEDFEYRGEKHEMEEAVKKLCAHIEEVGGVDGVIGFSQGGELAYLLAEAAEEGLKPATAKRLKFVATFGTENVFLQRGRAPGPIPNAMHFFIITGTDDWEGMADAEDTAFDLRVSGAGSVIVQKIEGLGHVMPKEKAVYESVLKALHDSVAGKRLTNHIWDGTDPPVYKFERMCDMMPKLPPVQYDDAQRERLAAMMPPKPKWWGVPVKDRPLERSEHCLVTEEEVEKALFMVKGDPDMLRDGVGKFWNWCQNLSIAADLRTFPGVIPQLQMIALCPDWYRTMEPILKRMGQRIERPANVPEFLLPYGWKEVLASQEAEEKAEAATDEDEKKKLTELAEKAAQAAYAFKTDAITAEYEKKREKEAAERHEKFLKGLPPYGNNTVDNTDTGDL